LCVGPNKNLAKKSPAQPWGEGLFFDRKRMTKKCQNGKRGKGVHQKKREKLKARKIWMATSDGCSKNTKENAISKR